MSFDIQDGNVIAGRSEDEAAVFLQRGATGTTVLSTPLL